MRALVIDDSAPMRRILAQILATLGIETVEACDGVDALEQIQRPGELDLALVDWNMPRMDGCAFVRAVRAMPSRRALPVLMVTTETQPARIIEALSAGVDEYLMKPFKREDLEQKLALIGVRLPDRE